MKEKPKYRELGQCLRQCMQRQQMSPATLSTLTGIEPGNLSNILNGYKNLQYSSLQRFARAFGIPLSEMLQGL